MARTPKFVRLADRLALGMLVDIESGWGVSGFDVRHFPDEEDQPVAFAWAKRQLALGNLEEAGQAEWDEVHEVDLEEDETPVVRFVDVTKGIPENKLREKVRTHEQKLSGRRQTRAEAALDEELDAMEAAATDDDEDYIETSAGGGRAGDAQGPTTLERRAAQRAAGEVKSSGKKKSKKKARQTEESEEETAGEEGQGS